MIAFQTVPVHLTCARHDGPPGKPRTGGPPFVAAVVLERGDCRNIFVAMGFRVISGTSVQEFVENVESATAALDRVRMIITAGVPTSGFSPKMAASYSRANSRPWPNSRTNHTTRENRPASFPNAHGLNQAPPAQPLRQSQDQVAVVGDEEA